MDELVFDATSEPDGCAADNLSRNGGITAVATTLSRERRKERRFMALKVRKNSLLCAIRPEDSPAQKFH
jgi:hypothetical protein